MSTEAQVEQRRRNAQTIAACRRAATHCKRGHEFTPANTYIRPDGRRACVCCQRDRAWYGYHGVRWSR